MIFGITQEQIQYWMGMQQATASGTADPIYQQWQESMKQYAADVGSGGAPTTNFWVVVSLPKENFSERVYVHGDLPLIMPNSGTGTLEGIATTKAELDKMTIAEGPGPNQGDEWKEDPRRKKMFITYKVKLQGYKAWRDLIEFCGEHDMLAPPD